MSFFTNKTINNCKEAAMPSHMKLSTQQDKEQCMTVNISGRLDANSVSEVWDRAQEIVNSCSAKSLVIDLEKVDYLDSAGAVLISTLEKGWNKTATALSPFWD